MERTQNKKQKKMKEGERPSEWRNVQFGKSCLFHSSCVGASRPSDSSVQKERGMDKSYHLIETTSHPSWLKAQRRRKVQPQRPAKSVCAELKLSRVPNRGVRVANCPSGAQNEPRHANSSPGAGLFVYVPRVRVTGKRNRLGMVAGASQHAGRATAGKNSAAASALMKWRWQAVGMPTRYKQGETCHRWGGDSVGKVCRQENMVREADWSAIGRKREAILCKPPPARGNNTRTHNNNKWNAQQHNKYNVCNSCSCLSERYGKKRKKARDCYNRSRKCW